MMQKLQHLLLTTVGFNTISHLLFYSNWKLSVTKMLLKHFTLLFPPPPTPISFCQFLSWPSASSNPFNSTLFPKQMSQALA